MKKYSILLLCLITMMFSSCIINLDTKAHLLIRNDAECRCKYISEIWLTKKNGHGDKLIWKGTLKQGDSEYLTFDPGDYSIKIQYTNPCYLSCTEFFCDDCPYANKGPYKDTTQSSYYTFFEKDYFVFSYDGAGLKKDY